MSGGFETALFCFWMLYFCYHTAKKNENYRLFKTNTCARTSTEGLKELRRKTYLYIDISKWLDFCVHYSNPPSIGQ